MFAQQAGPQEAPGADSAGVRFVGHVGLLVGSQVGRGGESLLAQRAAVQLLLGVDLEVLSEPGQLRVALPTDGAAVELRHAAGTPVYKHQHRNKVQHQQDSGRKCCFMLLTHFLESVEEVFPGCVASINS